MTLGCLVKIGSYKAVRTEDMIYLWTPKGNAVINVGVFRLMYDNLCAGDRSATTEDYSYAKNGDKIEVKLKQLPKLKMSFIDFVRLVLLLKSRNSRFAKYLRDYPDLWTFRVRDTEIYFTVNTRTGRLTFVDSQVTEVDAMFMTQEVDAWNS